MAKKTTFSYTQGDFEYGEWVHCPLPYKGIITEAPATLLDKSAATDTRGLMIKNGEVSPSPGYVKFPTPSSTKSNLVAGTYMRSDMYTKLDGASYHLLFTTTNLYVFNSSTGTWDNITKGVTVDTGESAWTASANVTSTADATIKIRGSKSAKHVVASAFTTGLASYIDFGATDFTAYTHLHFWVYSTVALTAGQVRVGIDETSALGGTPLYFDIPAIAANTWTACCVAGDFTGYNAVVSVGLDVVADVGTATIYLDDIRAVEAFTGDEDNRFSVGTMNDTFIYTNGVDHIGKVTESSGTFTVADLTTTLAAGDIATAEVVLIMMDHVIFLNTTENAADCPQRASWSNIGEIENYIGGTSGYQDLVDDDTWIVTALQLTRSTALIYKDDAIVLMEWISGYTPFRFSTILKGYGALCKDGAVYYQGSHAVLDLNVLYKFDGESLTILDTNIRTTFFGLIDGEYKNRAFLSYDEDNRELQFHIPSASAYPNDLWQFAGDAWYRNPITVTGYGHYKETSALTIGELVGTIGEQNWRCGDLLTRSNYVSKVIGNATGIFKVNNTTLNHDGSAVYRLYDTMCFMLPDTPEYLNKTMRVSKFVIEALGQSVSVSYSVDGGASWMFLEELTLSSVYKKYWIDFDVVSDCIMFRIWCNAVSTGFKFRYYGFYRILRTARF